MQMNAIYKDRHDINTYVWSFFGSPVGVKAGFKSAEYVAALVTTAGGKANAREAKPICFRHERRLIAIVTYSC